MAITFFDPRQIGQERKPGAPLRLPPKVQNDVFLIALLEMPTTKRPRRSPLEWATAMGLHILIIAVLIIAPLYTTGTISLTGYEDTPLVAPPPPAPPPPPAAGAAPPHATVQPKAHFTYSVRKLSAPTSIPKKVSVGNSDATAPNLGGVAGGVPGGVAGGELGGLAGGTYGGTGTAAPPPPPPPQAQPTKRVVRVGSLLKAPRQTLSVNPQYPPLARQTHAQGTVVVDAIIDEKGNVVQARAVSGNPLLIDAALKAVLQWKYEPTFLNGQPISVELEVQVHFNLNSN
ncbi:MAG TPA: energy transducer TonB [Candidatus Acidoferrum sp.]